MQGFFVYNLKKFYLYDTVMTNELEKPFPPADDDCCGGGACNPCVWDHYYAELQKWRIAQAKINEELSKESAENEK